MLLVITLHVFRRSLRLKGDGNGTRLGLDSLAFAERGHCALGSDDTDARNVVQKLLDAASSGPLVSAWWEHRLVAWHSPIPKRSGASRAVQVRAGRRLRR